MNLEIALQRVWTAYLELSDNSAIQQMDGFSVELDAELIFHLLNLSNFLALMLASPCWWCLLYSREYGEGAGKDSSG